MNFKKGDIVRLKSGGPLMTVGDIAQERVECFWFNHVSSEWTVQSYVFRQELLKSAPTD